MRCLSACTSGQNCVRNRTSTSQNPSPAVVGGAAGAEEVHVDGARLLAMAVGAVLGLPYDRGLWMIRSPRQPQSRA